MKRLVLLGLAGSVFAITGANCLSPAGTTKERVAALRTFGSAEELRTYLADQAKTRYWGNSNRSGGLFGLFSFAASGSADIALTANTAPTAESGDSQADETSDPFSTTTIQEAGVDESDVVKNDGQFIYVLEGNTIHIVLAVPPAGLVELSTIDIDSYGDSIYLRDNKLIALSRYDNYYYYWDWGMPVAMEASARSADDSAQSSPAIGASFRDGVQTTVTIVNVADPANPVVEATVRLEGSLASSRLIDNLLYLVLQATPRLPDNPTQARISAMSLEDWIPDVEIEDADGVVAAGDMAEWQDFYRPENPDGYGITAVVTIDVNAPTASFQSTMISADAGTVYASTEALYVADTNYDYSLGAYRTDTAVHKMKFTADGTAYAGSGLVPGRLLNQYSLGEYEGYLRVATTVEEYDSRTGSSLDNSVYVLGESGGSLAIVGKLEGLAPGEQIYSARFVGERGFLVTFRRVDPLFTLDLSDPTKPTVVGELKVPGYSDFILPMDENHLLTIGKDAEDAGSFAWIQGIKLAVFDVTDPAHPTQLHDETIGGRGSSSEANYNPKALKYFSARDALAFPADVYALASGGASWGQHEFTGLYVYRVTVADGFEFLGRISSSDSAGTGDGCFYGYYGFTRGVFIGDYVYSVTERSVKAAALSAVGTIIGNAALSNASTLTADCFGVPEIVLPAGSGLE